MSLCLFDKFHFYFSRSVLDYFILAIYEFLRFFFVLNKEEKMLLIN